MIHVEKFGQCPAGNVDAVTISNGKLSFTVLSYGATVQKILVPDANGNLRDVCLGYDTVDEYITAPGYFGSTVGRHANRIGGARYTYKGQEYRLTTNGGGNQLHGGLVGLDKKLWDYTVEGDKAVFTTRLLDGEEGFPGNLDVAVTFSIDGESGLRIDYKAVGDKDTVVNLTNHTYFNLNGAGNGTIRDHYIRIDADNVTDVDDGLIPTGAFKPVEGTALDLRKETLLDTVIDSEQLNPGTGFDHNYCVNGSGMRCVSTLYAPASGIQMDTESALEGLQFYGGLGIEAGVRKDGKTYGPQSGLCLETQHYPDAVNHENFPTPIVKCGEVYQQTTIYRFSVR